MKVNGITRCIDELRRIVIPKEIREALRIEPNTMLELELKKDGILVKVDNKKIKGLGGCSTEELIEEMKKRNMRIK